MRMLRTIPSKRVSNLDCYEKEEGKQGVLGLLKLYVHLEIPIKFSINT